MPASCACRSTAGQAAAVRPIARSSRAAPRWNSCPGAICNLGAGISTGISAVAAEEDILDEIVLTNEQGFIGGAPLTGADSGTAQNYDALVDQPYQFDFYDGGGLDLAFLSFAEVDPQGNVNVSRFGDKIVGVGGFINISQNARKMVFSGTFTAGGLEDRMRATASCASCRKAGTASSSDAIEQICYNATFAARAGPHRARSSPSARVFRATVDGGLELIEIAPGIDLERDVLAHMDFRPLVAEGLRPMDARIFAAGPMNLRSFRAPQSND